MADGTTLSERVGTGDVIATDDIAGVKFPRSKLVIGADGVNDGDVCTTNPLPINDAGGSITVDVGTALPAGANAIGKLAANTGVTIGAVEVAAAQTLATVTTLGTITNVVHVDDNSGSLTVD